MTDIPTHEELQQDPELYEITVNGLRKIISQDLLNDIGLSPEEQKLYLADPDGWRPTDAALAATVSGINSMLTEDGMDLESYRRIRAAAPNDMRSVARFKVAAGITQTGETHLILVAEVLDPATLSQEDKAKYMAGELTVEDGVAVTNLVLASPMSALIELLEQLGGHLFCEHIRKAATEAMREHGTYNCQATEEY